MGGWRDVEGRTASERKQRQRETARTELVDAAKRRPLTLMKRIVAGVFVLLLALALIVTLR